MEGNNLEFYTGTRAEIEGLSSSILGAIYLAKDGGIYSGTGSIAFNHSLAGTLSDIYHNSSLGIQGGLTDERYHINLTEYEFVQGLGSNLAKLDAENSFAEDQYFQKNIHVQGSINSYSQDELNIGDAWINLGTAEAVGIDGGMRIFGSSGSTELGRFYYDVSGYGWRLNSILYSDKSMYIGKGGNLGSYHLNIGENRIGNGYAYIDLIGDEFYTDYGLRVIRYNSGLNANSSIIHRGTGSFYLLATDGGDFLINGGNVGIGIEDPLYKLHIEGTGYFSGSTKFNSNIGSTVFSPGWTGSGWQYTASTFMLEVPNMTVRGTLSVYELLLQQIRATNGNVFVTSVAKVESVSGSQYFETIIFEDPSENNTCPFAVNDLIICQRSNVTGSSRNIIKQIVRRVDSVSGKSITVRRDGDLPVSTGVISEGDDFARFGNTTVTARQGSIYMSADDTSAPNIDIVSAVSSWTTWQSNNKLKGRLGRLDGITDQDAGLDGTQVNYFGLYSDNVHLKGHIYSNTGKIGAWTLSSEELYSVGISLNATRNYIRVHDGYGDERDAITMYYKNNLDYGIHAMKGSITMFRLGSTNKITSFNFDQYRFYQTTGASAFATGSGVLMQSTDEYASASSYVPSIQAYKRSGSYFTSQAWIGYQYPTRDSQNFTGDTSVQNLSIGVRSASDVGVTYGQFYARAPINSGDDMLITIETGSHVGAGNVDMAIKNLTTSGSRTGQLYYRTDIALGYKVLCVV